MALLNLISRGFGGLVRMPLPRWLRLPLLRAYAWFYAVDITEAARPLDSYASLAEFFVRELRTACRPFEPRGLSCPVDGELRGAGQIKNGALECIKGSAYGLARFLGGPEMAATFWSGSYFNFYLSPRDCHHVFAPLDLTVRAVRHIPGGLWPVNDAGMVLRPAVLAQNERVVVLADCVYGPIAIVLVGAFNVGSIELAFTKLRTNLGASKFEPIYFTDTAELHLPRAGKLGTFHLGSSVVVLLQDGNAAAGLSVLPGTRVKYGQRLL